MTTNPRDFIQQCRGTLASYWQELLDAAQDQHIPDFVQDAKLKAAIRRIINSGTKSYRYVLPTQLLAKIANPSLDCRSLQVASGGPGAFDARSLCHKVVVPFDKENESVLGGSPEPYVNNPLRVPAVTKQFHSQQKDTKGWDDLCKILGKVESAGNPKLTTAIFHQTLKEILKRLDEVSVTYPVPRRTSLMDCLGLVEKFLSERSGGDRTMAVASALFACIGQKFGLFSEVGRRKITVADSQSGLLADLECVDRKGNIALVVEVKDRELTIDQIKHKLPRIRSRSVSEIFFVVQQGVSASDKDEIDRLLKKEFRSGQNIYIVSLLDLCRHLLALLGESGRQVFLQEIGAQLDNYGSPIGSRQAWAELLGAL